MTSRTLAFLYTRGQTGISVFLWYKLERAASVGIVTMTPESWRLRGIKLPKNTTKTSTFRAKALFDLQLPVFLSIHPHLRKEKWPDTRAIITRLSTVGQINILSITRKVLNISYQIFQKTISITNFFYRLLHLFTEITNLFNFLLGFSLE